jgi:uncharacterized membrane protein
MEKIEMNTQANASTKTRRLVATAILAALVVVLQLASSFIKIGSLNLAFVLLPIVIGTVLYGVRTGAVLGFFFGLITFINCVFNLDPGGYILFSANPFYTAIICFTKAILAGVIPGLIYEPFRRKGTEKASAIGSVLASISAPIVNTATFCILTLVWFRDILLEWSAGYELYYYILFVLTGINFLVEFAINVVCSPVIIRLIKSRRAIHIED